MKKIFIFSLVLLALSLAAGPASAGSSSYFQFGVILGPPFFYFPPPPVYYAPPPAYYWPPPYYYGGYYPPSYRVWVPGYWDYRRTPYGWERAWIPGHWEWRN